MKSYPVALSFCSAISGLLLSACGAGNGELFEEVDAPSALEPQPPIVDPGAEPPVTPAPDPVEMQPPPAPPPDDSMSPPEVPDDELPLSGEDDDDIDEPDEEEPPAPPPDEPEIVLPEVVSVSPENGATGVAGETELVITFNVPMNRAATEAAYQSEGIPSSAVSFSWNEDSTVLTVTPNQPLAYDSGSDPADVQARRYSFFISSSAEDVEGNHLPTPEEFSFFVLREIVASVTAEQDSTLTGNFRSDGQYGTAQCAPGSDMTCVGDVRVNNANRQYKGFVTFDLSFLPSEMVRVSRATLRLEISNVSGDPWGNGNLGRLMLEHTEFESIGSAAFTSDPVTQVGPIANDVDPETVVSRDVSSVVAADAVTRKIAQFRLTFENATNNDLGADAILSARETQILDIAYLTP